MRRLPETRGERSAKEVELQRIKKIHKQRAERAAAQLKKAQPELREIAMNAQIEATGTKRREFKPKHFTQEEIQSLRDAVGDNCSPDAIKQCAEWFAGSQYGITYSDAYHSSVSAIRSLLNPVVSHNAKGFNQLVYIVANYNHATGGKQNPEPVVARPVVVEVVETDIGYRNPPAVNPSDTTDTSIIRRVGGLEFRLPSADLTGAQSATISCDELAGKLGYSRPSALKELSEKKEHKEKLSKFGHIRVSRKSVRCGEGFREVDETFFNRKQVLYLISKSGTDIANELTVQFIDAYDELCDAFRLAVTQPTGPDPMTAQALHMLASVQQTTNLLLGELLSRKRKPAPRQVPEQTVIPQTQEPGVVANSPLSEVPGPNDIISVKLRNHPRLVAMPKPGSFHVSKIHQTTRNLLDAWGQIAGNGHFDTPYHLTYDECIRTFDPDLKKKPHGSRIEFIRSKPQEYQLKVYECAFRVLVEPYVKG